MLNVVMLNVVMLNLAMLNAVVLNVNMLNIVYDNEITSLIDIYFLRISFTPSKPFRHPV